jgi:hypothetical protein
MWLEVRIQKGGLYDRLFYFQENEQCSLFLF